MEPVANTIAIVTASVQLLNAIHRCIEAIRDAPQQIRHLQSICQLAGSNLKDVELHLRTDGGEIPGNDDDHAADQIAPIAGLVGVMQTDLEHIHRIVESHRSGRLLSRIRRWDTIRALELKLSLNSKALRRIDRSMLILTWTTATFLTAEVRLQQPEQRIHGFKELRENLITEELDVSSTGEEPGSDDDDDGERRANGRLLSQMTTLKDWAFKKAKEFTKDSFDSGNQTPTPADRPPISDTPTDASKKLLLSDDATLTRIEQEYMYDEALQLTLHAERQNFPDVAADFHAQAMEIRSALDPDIGFEDQAEMDARHIRILLGCFDQSLQEEGRSMLESLAADIDHCASSKAEAASTLFMARKDVGYIYFNLRKYERAIWYLRGAIFTDGFLDAHEENQADIKLLFQTISTAYKRAGLLVKHGAFVKIVCDTLQYDPLADPSKDEAVANFFQGWNFDGASQRSQTDVANMRDDQGNCALHMAVLLDDQDADLVRRFSEPSMINAVNNDGLTPLFLAVEARKKEEVSILLEEGASLHIRRPRGDLSHTILHSCRDPAIMALLLDEMAQARQAASEPVTINSTARYSSTPLHTACERDDFETAKVLVEHGANVNLRNSDGMTALIITCYSKRDSTRVGRAEAKVELVKLLVQKGADVEAVDKDQRTAKKGLIKCGFTNDQITDMLSSHHNRTMSQSPDSGLGPSRSSSSVRSRISSVL